MCRSSSGRHGHLVAFPRQVEAELFPSPRPSFVGVKDFSLELASCHFQFLRECRFVQIETDENHSIRDFLFSLIDEPTTGIGREQE